MIRRPTPRASTSPSVDQSGPATVAPPHWGPILPWRPLLRPGIGGADASVSQSIDQVALSSALAPTRGYARAMANRVRLSKFLSLVLRHDPAAAGVTLDEEGWVSIDELLGGAGRAGVVTTRAELLELSQRVTSGGSRSTRHGTAFELIKGTPCRSTSASRQWLLLRCCTTAPWRGLSPPSFVTDCVAWLGTTSIFLLTSQPRSRWAGAAGTPWCFASTPRPCIKPATSSSDLQMRSGSRTSSRPSTWPVWIPGPRNSGVVALGAISPLHIRGLAG